MTEPQPIALTTWLQPPTKLILAYIEKNKKPSLNVNSLFQNLDKIIG
jgi:hypothetical protein